MTVASHLLHLSSNSDSCIVPYIPQMMFSLLERLKSVELSIRVALGYLDPALFTKAHGNIANFYTIP